MKRILIALFIVTSCSTRENTNTPNATETNPEIMAVENSLGRTVYLEGDSLWNIKDRMKFYGIPGASIAVIKDSKIAWTKAYGIMDRETGEPVTTETLFQAASISKPVTGYAVLKTVESGKIDLTSDVNTWLKTWNLPDNEFTKDRKVNVADLLSHTAGVTVHGFGGYTPGEPVPTLVQLLNGESPSNSDAIRVDKVPGGSFRYSGGGYCVMQQMMIDVYGKTFPEIMQELVLGPLDMNHSTFDQPLDDRKIKLAATGYVPNGDQTSGKRHTYPEMAPAGLWTTPEDLAKFAIDVQKALKGESLPAGQAGKVISKEMAEKMLTKVNDGMGLSMGVDDVDGALYFGHSGWNEGFSSQMFASRNDGYGVVVMINRNTPQFITEVMMAVGKAYNWKNVPAKYKSIAMDTSLFKSFRGRYRNGADGRITVTSNGDKLYFKFIRDKEPKELVRITDSTYLLKPDPANVQFKTLTDGNIDLIITKDDRHGGSHPKVKDDEMVPYEYLLAGDYGKALKGYQQIRRSNPNDHAIEKDNLLANVDRLNKEGDSKTARELMKIVNALYPKN